MKSSRSNCVASILLKKAPSFINSNSMNIKNAQMINKRQYEPEIIETLENSFGELEHKEDLGAALLSAAKNAVEDNIQDKLFAILPIDRAFYALSRLTISSFLGCLGCQEGVRCGEGEPAKAAVSLQMSALLPCE